MALFSTEECAWSQISVSILGRKLVGMRGFQVDEEVDKEILYAAGQLGIDIQEGNVKNSGNLKLLKFEVDMLNDAAKVAGYKNILRVPHTLISFVISYKKTLTSPMRKVVVTGVGFTSLTNAMEQGAKYTEITLPYLALDVEM